MDSPSPKAKRLPSLDEIRESLGKVRSQRTDESLLLPTRYHFISLDYGVVSDIYLVNLVQKIDVKSLSILRSRIFCYPPIGTCPFSGSIF
jgi:hypothetical protein